MLQAACAREDPELFYDEPRERVAEAKAVCARCPVKEPCRGLADQLEKGSHHRLWVGVGGGESPGERRGRRKATLA